MNNLDRRVYKALIFFSNRTLNEVLKLKEDDSGKYNKKVPKGIEDSIHREGYISLKKYGDTRDEDSAITTKGIEQLRILKDVKNKEKSIWISVIAVVISLLALGISLVPFAKSMGWI